MDSLFCGIMYSASRNFVEVFCMKKYFELLKNNGADLAIKITTDTIVTAAWTVYRCKYGCDTYGKSHCCPPNCPTWKETQELIYFFKYGILFRCYEMYIVTPFGLNAAWEYFLYAYD